MTPGALFIFELEIFPLTVLFVSNSKHYAVVRQRSKLQIAVVGVIII